MTPWAAALQLHQQRREHGPRAWRRRARPEQLPPAGWRRIWYVRGGRGGGKTWTGSNVLAEQIRTTPTDVDGTPTQWAVIAPTFADARDTCMEGPSGLLRALGLPKQYPAWNRSQGQLTLDSGQVVYAGGADDGALRVQGKNLAGLWADEIGLWKRWKQAWDESIRYAVRVRLPDGKRPQIIATGTPKRSMPARKLVKRLIDDPKVAVTLLRTVDNAANLDEDTVADLLTMAGTALGQQELEGVLLDDVEGARWSADLIAELRYTDPVPELDLVVVAVDPAVTSKERSDHTGISVVGRATHPKCAQHQRERCTHGYLLHSERIKGRPEVAMGRAATLLDVWAASYVVIEANNGGDYLPFALQTVAPGTPTRTVHATGTKMLRLEGLATLCEAGRWHHVGHHHEALEGEMVSFTGAKDEDSPDVLDSAVWAQEAVLPVEHARPRRPRGPATLHNAA